MTFHLTLRSNCYLGYTERKHTKKGGLPLRLDTILQDSSIVLSLVQWQNVHVTSVGADDSCVDRRFTDAGTLWHGRVNTRSLLHRNSIAIWIERIKRTSGGGYHTCQRQFLSAVWSSSLNNTSHT